MNRYLGIGGHMKFTVRTETSKGTPGGAPPHGLRKRTGLVTIKDRNEWRKTLLPVYSHLINFYKFFDFDGQLESKRVQCHPRKARVGRLLTVAGRRICMCAEYSSEESVEP
ncbi:hypothetical protein EVAR_65108_1 [Eumeta japonica]|uniref:Uncharacterized protein n=1 Tax=Eumeta variegata TaxID=151549 RepID=A0A4C1ZVY0_EUMVA|nr:hypothetical protein EVAR_65108_1 [Eumeta japonica]